MLRDTAIVARHTCVLLGRDPGTLIAYTVMSSVLMVVLHPVYERLAAPGASGVLSAASGTAVMFTLLALDVAGEQLLSERDWHTWDRLRASSVSRAALLVGKALPLVVVFLALQALLYGEAAWWFGLDLAGGAWRLPVLCLLWACCVASLGLALGAWLRSRGRLGAVADIGAMVMMGLSGALVPLGGLPGWFTGLAPATPGYWAVHGVQAAFRSGSGYGTAVAALCAVTLAAGALAVVRIVAFPGRR
ncbi:hypothetical protein Psi02_49810 [Planotetraspora silvatica]|uniref:ABC-2 type transporter transmembrane domain-containing protein n=1 Tax=Planotetraspora silvatica TaxID=234614 RepID=A0A8J3UNX6_9ACTN|nr:ABC transporter permease [Planotetraspora silvatica]GII48557.1 hypothetical protein Psi02_49810 [Planotetraspora silvatica]